MQSLLGDFYHPGFLGRICQKSILWELEPLDSATLDSFVNFWVEIQIWDRWFEKVGRRRANMADAAGDKGLLGAGGPPLGVNERLIITHMTLENFKSYAGVQQIGPFHKVTSRQQRGAGFARVGLVGVARAGRQKWGGDGG